MRRLAAAVLATLELLGAISSTAQRTCGSDPQAQCSDQELASFGSDDLAVQPSSIEGGGLGAFARREFGRGDALGTYHCVIADSLESENSRGAYGWNINATHVCDAEPIRVNNPLRYVNSVAAEETCDRQNVAMRLGPRDRDSGSPTVEYFTTGRIHEGDELLVDYGERYFKVRSACLSAQRSPSVPNLCCQANPSCCLCRVHYRPMWRSPRLEYFTSVGCHPCTSPPLAGRSVSSGACCSTSGAVAAPPGSSTSLRR